MVCFISCVGREDTTATATATCHGKFVVHMYVHVERGGEMERERGREEGRGWRVIVRERERWIYYR